MKTEVLPATSPHALPHAADILRHGGLVAFPTDTVYGLAASIKYPNALRQLYVVKGRPSAKAIAILLANASELEQVAGHIPAAARQLAATFWPGGLTLIFPRHASLPDTISSLHTVGIRIPDHPVALGLLQVTGPLAVTSANRSGEPNSLNAKDVLEDLGGRIDLVIDGGTVQGGQPSTVVDCTVDPPKVLRPGPISEAEIEAALAASLP